jgi:carnitine O-acetyltransferase
LFSADAMSYSSMAVRYFTAPKPLRSAMEAPRSQPSADTMVNPSSNSISVNGGSSAAQSSEKKGLTFAHQDSLPKLPIPDLESTCKKYMESLSALQTPREQEETKAAVEEFLKTDGPILQEKLKNYASSKTSYIEQFCTSSLTHTAYNDTNIQPHRVRLVLEL